MRASRGAFQKRCFMDAFVGADAHIGPFCPHAEPYGWAGAGIGPYRKQRFITPDLSLQT